MALPGIAVFGFLIKDLHGRFVAVHYIGFVFHGFQHVGRKGLHVVIKAAIKKAFPSTEEEPKTEEKPKAATPIPKQEFDTKPEAKEKKPKEKQRAEHLPANMEVEVSTTPEPKPYFATFHGAIVTSPQDK